MHAYFMSRVAGSGTLLAPPELVELSLMEKFYWTPMEIDEIPFGRLQRIFISLQAKDEAIAAAEQLKLQQERGRAGKSNM